MDDNALTIVTTQDLDPILDLVINSLTSQHSRRAYAGALSDFMYWWNDLGKPTLTKALIQRYRAQLQTRDLAPATINQHIAAIRKLISEAADNGLIDPAHAAGIAKIKGVRSAGTRRGNWLDSDTALELIELPDTSRLLGMRDRAIIACLIGAGLRRSELVSLQVSHLVQREGCWVIIDLVGKGNKTRSIPIPDWVYQATKAWMDAAGILAGCIFRPVHKGDGINGDNLSPQAVYSILSRYTAGVKPHDLRRTFAKLAYAGGSPLDQIQLSLGHASIQTTERYLGIEQDLTDAPGDHIFTKRNARSSKDLQSKVREDNENGNSNSGK